MYEFLKSKISIEIKANLKNFLKHLRTRSLKELNYKKSYFSHNIQYLENDAYQREYDAHKAVSSHTKNKKGHLNNIYEHPNSVGYFLDRNVEIKNLVDIGSGTGWFVNYVSQNYPIIEKIFAIEPSKAAVKISQKIYPNDTKIQYKNGFAHIELKNLQKDVYLITTFAVFLHLNFYYTKKILKILDNKLEKNSIIILKEPIAHNRFIRFNLHYPRSRKFWNKNLKNFDVEFYNYNLIIAKKN